MSCDSDPISVTLKLLVAVYVVGVAVNVDADVVVERL